MVVISLGSIARTPVPPFGPPRRPCADAVVYHGRDPGSTVRVGQNDPVDGPGDARIAAIGADDVGMGGDAVRRTVRAVRRRGATPALAFCGALLGLALAARVEAPVGPFDATFSLRPAMTGDTVVRLAPLGRLHLDTHDAPFAVEVRVDELRLEDAEAISRKPELLTGIEDELADDARRALRRLVLQAVLAATVGAALLPLLRRFTWQTAVGGGTVGLAVTVLGASLGALTWRPEAVYEPRYTGLLTIAPQAVGDVVAISRRFDRYREQLARLVKNVADLYEAGEGLPVVGTDGADETVRVLHVSDIHLNPQAFDVIRQLVKALHVDAIVDTGDLTDWGSSPEDELVAQIGRLDVPYVYVRGNHDSQATQDAVAAQPNAVVLDGETREVVGLRFFGVGDPRFTPDKSNDLSTADQKEAAQEAAPRIADELRREDPPADVLAVHDARLAARSGELVPLILSGHTHTAKRARIGGAISLVQGSTGGAGLRSLDRDEPTPLSATLLTFDKASRRLVAYDQVTVDGLGRTGVRIERHVVPTEAEDAQVPPPTSAPASPQAQSGDGAGATSSP